MPRGSGDSEACAEHWLRTRGEQRDEAEVEGKWSTPLDKGRDASGVAELGTVLPQSLAARQDYPEHTRRQLHRWLHVADLREGRHRHMGDAGARLSDPGGRTAAIRAARLPAGHFI